MKTAKINRAEWDRMTVEVAREYVHCMSGRSGFRIDWNNPMFDRERVPALKKALCALFAEKTDALIDAAVIMLACETARSCFRGYASKAQAEHVAALANLLANDANAYDVKRNPVKGFPFAVVRKPAPVPAAA